MVIYGRLIELSRRSVGAEYFLPLVRRPTKFPSGPGAIPSYSAALQESQPFWSWPHEKDKKHLAKTDSKFNFSSIFEGGFFRSTEHRGNFTKQQSQSLIFSDSGRPGGYRSLGKLPAQGKTVSI